MGVQLTQEMINGAILTQEKYGVPASVTLGQIILESGGSYPGGLSGLAYNDNNLFGIKAGSSWKGKTATYNTTEYNSEGQAYKTSATFRKYDSVAQSIDDHGKLLSSSTYTSKTAGTTNLNDYVNAMGSVYATSPTYASNLMSVIKTNNLTQYDTGTFPQGSTEGTQQYTVQELGIWNGEGVFGTDFFQDMATNVVKFIVILLIVILAMIFFLKAFDVTVPVKNMASKVITKKTGIKTGSKNSTELTNV